MIGNDFIWSEAGHATEGHHDNLTQRPDFRRPRRHAGPSNSPGEGACAHGGRTGYPPRSTAAAHRPVFEEVRLTKPNKPPPAMNAPPLPYLDPDFLTTHE